MLYLIGGAPRVGKTSLAHMLLLRKRVPFVSTDVLTHALSAVSPDLNIEPDEWKRGQDAFFEYLEAFLKYAQSCLGNYAVEGTSFRPDHAARLRDRFEIRVCFLGTSRITLGEIKGYSIFDEWVGRLPIEEQIALPGQIMSFSACVETDCRRLGLGYFDIAGNREAALVAALSNLVDPASRIQ